MGLLNTIKGLLPSGGGIQRSAGFMRETTGGSPFFFSWNPALRDSRYDVWNSYQQAAARTIDVLHNSGWISGGIEQSISLLVGTGLRLTLKPDFDTLGWDVNSSNDWARLVERRWEGWSRNPLECDVTGRQTIPELCKVAVRTWFAYGEILALMPYVRRGVSSTGTKVQLIEPHRLVQMTNLMDRMVQGIQMDSWGFPKSYRFQNGDQLLGDMRWVDIRARDRYGRPQVIHVANLVGSSAVRGITPLVSALKVVKQYDQLSDATLTAALIQAIFAATVESDAPTEQILQALQNQDEQNVGTAPNADGFFQAKAGWYKNTKIDLGTFGKIAHLFPGEKLNFHGSEHPNSTYEAFAKFLLREIARCIGITFEQLTGDYTGATYSSVRMSTAEVWQIALERRQNVVGKFLQPIFECWLEEEIGEGRIPFPGGLDAFIANKGYATRSEWRGSAKPQADDKKAAESHQIWKTLGVITDEMIANDLGVDWEDVYEQRKREMDMRKKLGLPEGDTMTLPEPEKEDAGPAKD